MREFIRVFLLILNIISFAGVLILAGFGVICEILNPPKFESLLTKLSIPMNYNQYLHTSYVCFTVCLLTLIITLLIRKKFFGG